MQRRLSLGGFVAFVWLAFGLAEARAAALDPAIRHAVDAAVRRALAEDGAPSASIAIVLDGEIAYEAAYGAARLAPHAAATTATRYQLASISKSLTAQALLLLEQDGKLSLDDPIRRWLPDVTEAGQVTVRELLQHTAGFPNHYPQTYPAGPRSAPTTPDQIIAEWGHHPLLFQPGTQFRYSNLDYVLAGRIVEKITGEPLFAFIDERILAPLGMRRTIDLDMVTPDTPELAIGYVRPALGPLEPAPDEGRGWSFGAGQIVTTPGDLARWDAAFLAGRLLSPPQSEEEVTPPKLADGSMSDYALGLFVSHRGGRTLYYHAGQGLGFLGVNRLYPAEHAAIIVLTNNSGTLAFQHIADRLDYLVLPPSSQDAEARAVFAALQAGKPDRSRFTPDLDAYFDRHRVTAYARSLGRLGPVESFVLRSEDAADGLGTRFYDVIAGGQRLRLVEQIAADGKLESFDVQPAPR